ncbi:hypothetical protein PR048_005334 [Dryococelus australis]|uniref:CCHC-type domain-containing protein n=1 Tax=Dryococelus australis TaxID=614101 RepID=A0ABQ9I7X3_9NEOP|nr:hypothetical protein PR048_005334 [Dryococelus australis]
MSVPKKPAELTYIEAVMMIHKHMQPKRNYIAERFKFDKHAQQPDESISEFIIALKGLSVHCDFGDMLLERLHDKLCSTTIKEQESQKPMCFCCGKENHTRAECKYHSYKCNRCNKHGHLQVVCKSASVQYLVNNDDDTQIYTSPAISVVPYTLPNRYFQHVDSKIYQWGSPPTKGRGIIKPKGVINVNVKRKLSEISLPLNVVEKGVTTLLG